MRLDVRLIVIFLFLLALPGRYHQSAETALEPPVRLSETELADEPDLLLRLGKASRVPANAFRVERFVLPTNLTRERWVSGFDFRPGDRRVVHRASFYSEKTGQWLGGWAPWQKMISFAEGVGFLLPAGSRIILEIQYMGTTEEVFDNSALGLWFAPKRPSKQITGLCLNARFEVPANHERFQVRREFIMPSDLYAVAVFPEMKATGQSLELSAVNPDGSSKVLLSFNGADAKWQTPYVFAEPVFLSKGARILATAYYANVENKPVDELFKLTLSFYPRNADPVEAPVRRRRRR